MNKIKWIKTWIIILFFSGLNNIYCQDTDSKNIKTTQIVRELADIKVVISQYKSLIQAPKIPYCVADIKIYKNSRLIDSVNYNEIEPVGGLYGFFVYPDLIGNHIIISKYGDYSGATIIVNKNGEKFKTIGGYSYYDSSSNFLFSILDSDLSGLSVFDLNKDSEIFKIVDIEERPKEFYKNDNGQFYFSAINDETGVESIWEFEFDLDRIMQMDLTKDYFKSGAIKALIDYENISVNCE
jgi:hypothetical protein